MADYELVNLTMGTIAYALPYLASAHQYWIDKIEEDKREYYSDLEEDILFD